MRFAFAAAIAVTAMLVGATAAQASCIQQSAAERRARADVIFDGVALEGPTATGVQRFKVLRYRKSRGPAVLRVQTGNRVFANGTGSITSVSIVVRKGQRWRILAQGSVKKVLQTSVCNGSRRL